MCINYATKRGTTLLMAPLALAAAVSSVAQAAEVKLPETTLTASMRSSFAYTQFDGTTDDKADFNLDSLSLYINGKITDNVKFSFSSEIISDRVVVQDAIAQFEFDPKFNIWAGRLLAPTDRANSYGAYFSNNWNFYADGVQDAYPSVSLGRSDGVVYWGDFADTKLKVSAGLFDIPATKGLNKTMAAARVQYDFWDAEPGYYINGTYLGEKDILALGVAANAVDSDKAANIDFLMEKKVGAGGAFTVEASYLTHDGLPSDYQPNYTSGDGYYGLVAYLFPQAIGPGKVQVLAKFGTSKFEDGPTADFDVDTAEFNVNYIIKSFNARVSLFAKDSSSSDDAIQEGSSTVGLGVQLMTL